MPPSLLNSLQNFLAVIGGLAIILGPLLKAWVRQAVQDAAKNAPAVVALEGRIDALEETTDRHEQQVAQVPTLVAILDRMERTLENLDTTLRDLVPRVAHMEGARL